MCLQIGDIPQGSALVPLQKGFDELLSEFVCMPTYTYISSALISKQHTYFLIGHDLSSFADEWITFALKEVFMSRCTNRFRRGRLALRLVHEIHTTHGKIIQPDSYWTWDESLLPSSYTNIPEWVKQNKVCVCVCDGEGGGPLYLQKWTQHATLFHGPAILLLRLHVPARSMSKFAITLTSFESRQTIP